MKGFTALKSHVKGFEQVPVEFSTTPSKKILVKLLAVDADEMFQKLITLQEFERFYLNLYFVYRQLDLRSPNGESNRDTTKKKEKKEKLFQWFYNNFLHANPKKCHFLTNNSEKTSTNIKSERILSSSSQKL